MCMGMNGEWEARRGQLWITLYPDRENPVMFKGSFQTNNTEMVVAGAEDKQKSRWNQTEKTTFAIMLDLDACGGE